MAKMGHDAIANKKEVYKKKPKTQEKASKPIQPFWRESTSSSEMGQPPKMPQREQQTEGEMTPREIKRKENQDQTVQIKKSKCETGEETEKEEKEEMTFEPEKKEGEKLPIKGKTKWEKEEKPKPIRSSTRNHKKPNLLVHNVMVTKVEPESSAEKCLPSVFEIAAPENK